MKYNHQMFLDDFCIYCARGEIHEVKARLSLIEPDSTWDSRGWQPLHWAAQEGHLEIVRLLLDAGFDVNSKTKDEGLTPLAQAFNPENNFETMELLLRAGADPNAGCPGIGGDTALHTAAAYDEVKIAQLLLGHGASLNVLDTEGITPYIRAKLNDSKHVLRLFEKHMGMAGRDLQELR